MSSYAEILKHGLDDKSFTNKLPPKPKTVTNTQKKEDDKNKIKLYHIDAGINLTHRNLSNKVQKILQEAIAYNVRQYVIISHSVTDAHKVVSMVRDLNKISNNRYKVYCTIGVQPHDAERTLENQHWLEELDKLISENLDIVIAVGKCGLDYDRMFAPKNVQIEVFEGQLDLAYKYSLPLFLHERFSKDDFLKVLDATMNPEKPWRGLIHCFTGGEDLAKIYMDRGFYVSITGRVCDDYQNGELNKAIKNVIPNDRLLIATDAPYMTPKDLKRRPYYNGSQFVPHICGRVANIKGMRKDELAKQIQENFKCLFGITE